MRAHSVNTFVAVVVSERESIFFFFSYPSFCRSSFLDTPSPALQEHRQIGRAFIFFSCTNAFQGQVRLLIHTAAWLRRGGLFLSFCSPFPSLPARGAVAYGVASFWWLQSLLSYASVLRQSKVE